MQIEISEATNEELQRRAAAAGIGVGEYLEGLVLDQRGPSAERKEPLTVEEWRAMLERSGATSGRNGRPWREFIHEGHKY
jgi:hypothetical protein